MHKKALGIIKASKASYDFIQVCWKKGLCTFEEAKKAMKSVHEDCMNDIDDLYNPQFMLDKKMEAMNYE
jgi:hypothetical protein